MTDTPSLPEHLTTSEREALFPLPDPALAGLRALLVQQADDAGLVEVAYRTLDTPLGPLLLAATAQGLVRVAFEREDFDAVLAALASRVSPRVLEAPRRLDEAAVELEEYFTGTRRRFDLPLDRALSTGFREKVQRVLPRIDYGSTRSYKEIAELVGSPRAVRAVGAACATNPLPIVVPCHRVLRTDGALGGYVGGLDAKTALLTLERTA
ncbi:methylated-DNA--[protein]-cysteine S-methyltransferase [Brachybacterium paraconglomeratum]|uniref:methylated-DNA--[protein]-cysteine S-methyltransferase n=1 Tax=Brachybacterium paraconglomeratum TaxID=173362 RepID=UPI0022AEB089|nr:methylated-DNA--[protein]-cysteine S-methyltransferase [Brachybacterium paraconglomeratum]MCZ4327733.1 methylated-DNA--[protein]-cysteine S-methyltransferase [Brachybacterium paraconglomeratum]